MTHGPGEHALDAWCERKGVAVNAWHYRVVGVCSLGVASEAAELLCLGYVMPLLAFGGNAVSDIEKGHISAAAFAGMMVGGLGVGFASDRHGRKPWLILCSAIAAASGFAGAAATSFRFMVFCRVMAGLGVGGSVPVIFSLAQESLPSQARHKLMVYVASGWMCGSLFAAASAWLLLGQNLGSWRSLMVLCAFPALLCSFFTCFFTEESPRLLFDQCDERRLRNIAMKWTLTVNSSCKESALDELIQVMHRQRTHSSSSSSSSSSSTGIGSIISALGEREETNSRGRGRGNGGGSDNGSSSGSRSGGDEGSSPLWALVTPGPIRHTGACLLAAWMGLSFGWYGLVLWMPSLLERRGLALGLYQEALMVSLANLPGNLLSAALIQRWGPAKLCAWSLALAAACTVAMAALPIEQQAGLQSQLPLQPPPNDQGAGVEHLLPSGGGGGGGSGSAAPTPGPALNVSTSDFTTPPTLSTALTASASASTPVPTFTNMTSNGTSSSNTAGADSSSSHGHGSSLASFLTLALACGFNAFATSAWNALDILSAEAFPSELRSSALGMLAASGRVASMVAQWTNGYLINGGTALMLLVTSGAMTLGTVGALAVGSSASNGKPSDVSRGRHGHDGRGGEEDSRSFLHSTSSSSASLPTSPTHSHLHLDAAAASLPVCGTDVFRAASPATSDVAPPNSHSPMVMRCATVDADVEMEVEMQDIEVASNGSGEEDEARRAQCV